MVKENRIWANPHLWHLWSWCLKKANPFNKRWVSILSGKGMIDIEIDKGQFVFGRHSASEDLGISPSTVWQRMNKLKRLGFIDINSNKQYSIITICNYSEHQGANNSKVTAKMTANNKANTQPNDTTKKLKKEKNLKKEDKNICEEIFERFWKEYPKRNGKRLNRAQAKKEFDKIKDVNSVLIAVSNYSCSTDVKRGIGIKDAFRWLRDGCWKDWMEPEDGGGVIASGDSVVCEQCGGRFKQRNKSNKFCSVKCYEAFRNG